ncbi:MAG: hypothetical protein WKF43_04715 [Acidimicrobiales bacterium]
MTMLASAGSPATGLGAGRPGAAEASICELAGRTVSLFRVAAPAAGGGDGETEAAVVGAGPGAGR